jgi:hypothetical protein
MSDENTSVTPPATISDVKYYAAVLTATGALETRSFDTPEMLVEYLRELVDHDVSVACFAGTKLGVSKPPFRHLITPWNAYPLFAAQSNNFEEDTSGYLGLDPVHLEAPPTIAVQPSRSSVVEDEFFSDGDDEAIDIFSSRLPEPED